MSLAVIPQNQIPPREAGTNKRFIDLTSWYTHALTDDIHHKQGNTLSDLGTGLMEIDGCFFDIRGMVQLAGKDSEIITSLCYPHETGPIELGFKLKSLHFLHASAWNIGSEKVQIGEYRINYEDNTSASIPLLYRNNIYDWWGMEHEMNQKTAWKGSNERTASVGHHIRLFHFVCVNSQPEITVKSLELVSNLDGPGPFVVAVTADLFQSTL